MGSNVLVGGVGMVFAVGKGIFSAGWYAILMMTLLCAAVIGSGRLLAFLASWKEWPDRWR